MVLQPGVLKQVLLQPWVFAAKGVTIRGLTTRASYNQRIKTRNFLQLGVLEPGVFTTVISYNKGFLKPGVLTIKVFQGGVLQTRVLATRVLTTRGLTTTRGFTTRGLTTRGSYKKGFLQPGVF